VLFDASGYLTAVENHEYAVTPDDKHFLFVRPVGGPQRATAGQLVLVKHWIDRIGR
jgi:hypothetical protein